MADATEDLAYLPYGKDGRFLHVPVDGGARIYANTMVAQLTATGMLVRASAASSGPVVGMASHGVDTTGLADAVKECKIEFDRVFRLNNGATTDAFGPTSPLGATCFLLDDNTVADNSNAGARKVAGTYRGMEPDGKVRVYIDMDRNQQMTELLAAIAAL